MGTLQSYVHHHDASTVYKSQTVGASQITPADEPILPEAGHGTAAERLPGTSKSLGSSSVTGMKKMFCVYV